MKLTDVLVIGAGITGTAVARELSRYDLSLCVSEAAGDVAEGATKANSGIIHAGYDAKPGTLKAQYNVRGASLYPSLCEKLGVPYRRCGALVIALMEEDTAALRELKNRGEINGVAGLRIIGRQELLAMEPCVNPEAAGALEVPASAVVSPYEMAFALADDAALNGARFFFDSPVTAVSPEGGGRWLVQTPGETFSCRAVVNCAGSSGAAIHNMIADDGLRMVHRRGQYYLLDRTPDCPFSRTVFQCPTKMGKGVLISPTVHGNLIIGPNAEDIDDPLDTATTADGLAEVLRRAAKTWPGLSVRSNITNFSGVRAHLETGDFLVGSVSGYPGVFEAIGIESPGLSSAPAIAEDIALWTADYLGLRKKEHPVPYPRPPKSFHDMSDDERRQAVSADPLHGRIICRCETVTEAEIRAAVRRPVGARSVDGVKRRTRAGMGRCQGGFCSPRVAAILSEELGCPLSDITKGGGFSRLLAGTVEEFLKAGDSRD